MSYMSPPESRSRVENIKKKFEATNSGQSPSSDNKSSPNNNALATKTQSSNGIKNTSPKRKLQETSNSTATESSKRPSNSPSTMKSSTSNTPIKPERQFSNLYGRGSHIRRSPAFRCDKIVKGRNVTGQTSGIRERTKSVVDNKVKLFEDGQSVKSVVKRLNTPPSEAPLAEQSLQKSPKPQLTKQKALSEEGVIDSRNAGSASLSNGDCKTNNKTDNEKSTSFLHQISKPVNSSVEYTPVTKVSSPCAPVPSFLHKKFDEDSKAMLPLEIKRNVINRALEKSKGLKNNNVESYAKVNNLPKLNNFNNVNESKQNGVRENSDSDITLTDTLKAALKAPLPPGPPPKKPPRTFAHNVSSATTSAMNIASSKDTPPRHVNFTKSASADVASAEKTGKPVRSKTESEIKLKKLESVLLNHQQSSGVVVLRPKSPMVRRHVEDKATATYDEPEAVHCRVGPLPSLPSGSELLSSFKSSTASENSAKLSGCINLNCVSNGPSNPMYSQMHFYEKIPKQQSEFFIAIPKKHPSPPSGARPYGTLMRSRSRSEEHIYAEPFEFLKKNQTIRENHPKLRSPVIKSGESIGDLSQVVKSSEELQKDSPPCKHKTAVLHYLCTPISPDGTTATPDSEQKVKSSELKTPVFERRASEPQNMGSDSDDKKKPSLLRFAALMRGGQAGGVVEGAASKVDRTKVQLLMNQAFGTPLQGLPTSPLELAGSDSDSMASTPDDGGFVVVYPEAGPASPDSSKAGLSAAKCVDSAGDGEDSSSTNSAEQQEQLTRLSEERKVYVRRVSSRMYHRVRSTATTPSAFPHLFQCILLVGLNLDSGDKKIKVPYIKTKYPLDADVPPHIEHLCFPDAKDWPPPMPTTPPSPGGGGVDEQSYSLVITNELGERRFGYCRRVLPEGSNICLPLAYCIISPFRASGFYYRILAELESRHGQPEWLQTAFIKELYSCQFPGPGQGLRLSTANTTYNVQGPICSMVTTVVRRPLDSRLEERDLTQLFSALPVPALLQLFGSLLLERRVILISNSLSRLSSCVEALQSILYPFSWQHTLIPVLPTSLLDICLSPTPYIVGILRGRDASTVPGPIEESLMVDLDESKVLQGVGDEASILPSRLRRCLKVALQLVTNTTQPRDASRNVLISEAFVRMFVEVCGHYRNHIVTQQDGLRVFERESFIKAVNSQTVRLFLEWFTETAMFTSFIDSRLEGESDIRGMFDQRCMEHSEEMENNTKLFLRNYKVLNKKVKTFGDRLKDWAPFS